MSIVEIKTSLGDLTVELFDEDSPITVKNFLQYIKDEFYDGTIFHRVIPNFMAQCGGFNPGMTEKSNRDPIKNEADNGQKNSRGTLAMARTSDVNSATSQFFINLADNGFLDHGDRDFGYAVFGKLTAGQDVLDTIGAVKTGNSGGHGDVPVEDVLIETMRVV
jgi:peptidyl-prolyl cis-trans isomerase A (cyclophilin A)